MAQHGNLVLIVDDNDTVRESLQVVLDVAGYATQAYVSGSDLLAAIDHQSECCILLDSLMPGMNGLEVLKRLKRTRPDLPVIIITGGGDTKTSIAAIEAGAVDYLEKPVIEEALFESIEATFKLTDCGDDNVLRMEETAYAFHKLERLTDVERKIFDMLVIGKSDHFIGTSLSISAMRVIKHRDDIMEKAEANNLIQLKRMAFLSGLALSDTANF